VGLNLQSSDQCPKVFTIEKHKMDYDWKRGGRRTMMLRWAENLRDKTKAAGLPFMFKQVTSARSGVGVNALGRDWHEYPDAPHG
jgi:protein gp37